ncbi:MAG: acetyl-CoA carboxylase biotin carboxylase subunit [Armatimonadetes bacterium]|nr:acetyl-CoA carboxylase biotin carboxylase subunit [Armatimonadota bacterium]
MFKKILVANRGDIAVRVIRAAHEMRIPTVAVYSQADADSLPVRLADEAVCIGPPERKGSYLHAPNILSAAVITGCDALHPGIGFLAEVASFAEMCDAIGLKYIGPPVKAIETMGDKIEARASMEKAGVPVVPGTNVAMRDPLEASKIAAKIGFPVMIKAAGGGGGRGIRVVQNEEEFPKILKTAQVEAESSFGNPDVYIEKFIDTFRHIEVQVLADEHGNVIHLGERDCSLQTQRYQKMVEEAPAPHLPPAVRKRICEAAVRAAKACGYASAGTVEFIVAPDGTFYFMEMNTRLQIEHPITEMVTGIDLVKQQIKIAAGEKLPFGQRDIRWDGHAIEVRLTARDPDRDFAPNAGPIRSLRLPGGLGVRVDTHIFCGYEVPPYYDSMLAKIIVWAEDRAGAIARMQRALDEVEITGIKTDLEYHKRIFANAFFRKGDLSTKFLMTHLTD